MTPYTSDLINYFCNGSNPPTNEQIRFTDEFFNRTAKYKEHKRICSYIVKTAVNTMQYFPKVAQLNKILDQAKQIDDFGMIPKTAENQKHCRKCGNSGGVRYYKHNDGRVLSFMEYHSNLEENAPNCYEFICLCDCKVGMSLWGMPSKRITDIFPNGYDPIWSCFPTQDEKKRRKEISFIKQHGLKPNDIFKLQNKEF